MTGNGLPDGMRFVRISTKENPTKPREKVFDPHYLITYQFETVSTNQTVGHIIVEPDNVYMRTLEDTIRDIWAKGYKLVPKDHYRVPLQGEWYWAAGGYAEVRRFAAVDTETKFLIIMPRQQVVVLKLPIDPPGIVTLVGKQHSVAAIQSVFGKNCSIEDVE